jgi:hypothetical protein
MRIVARMLGRLALTLATLVILANVFGLVLVALGVGHPT